MRTKRFEELDLEVLGVTSGGNGLLSSFAEAKPGQFGDFVDPYFPQQAKPTGGGVDGGAGSLNQSIGDFPFGGGSMPSASNTNEAPAASTPLTPPAKLPGAEVFDDGAEDYVYE